MSTPPASASLCAAPLTKKSVVTPTKSDQSRSKNFTASKSQSSCVSNYLLAYNSLSALAWLAVLWTLAISSYTTTKQASYTLNQFTKLENAIKAVSPQLSSLVNTFTSFLKNFNIDTTELMQQLHNYLPNLENSNPQSSNETFNFHPTSYLMLVVAKNTFLKCDKLVRVVQSFAILEVGHSLFGFVSSPMGTTAAQVASRILLVWGIAVPFSSAVQETLAFATMLLAWSVTEVIRYAYFTRLLIARRQADRVARHTKNSTPSAQVCKNSFKVPTWLEWLRYNTFIILYPIGILSECRCIYVSIPFAKLMYPAWVTYLLQSILAIYIPGSYIMYTHMMKQRRRIAQKARKNQKLASL